ncbi:MAG: succinate dehydrogenase cytochrome b subunit [Gemmatimonadota bacterium]|nr:succinate dehydrogenase cytochrome b subunit [Gemmatimonadota bacterium]
MRLTMFWRSTIGKKIVMAVTGLIFVGFVIGHLSGNLLVFRGPEKINAYSAFLHSLGGLLWVVRVVLLVSVILHATAAYQLTALARAARPIGYAEYAPQVSTFAARTIRWGGTLILVFVILHLLHFTTGTLQPVPFSEHDVYANVVGAFRIWWVAALYIVAMIALGLHLYHGAWSSFRTLGAIRPSAHPLKRTVAAAVAVLVWLGFTLVPVAILIGYVR